MSRGVGEGFTIWGNIEMRYEGFRSLRRRRRRRGKGGVSAEKGSLIWGNTGLGLGGVDPQPAHQI